MIILVADTREEIFNANIDSYTVGHIATGAAIQSGKVMEIVEDSQPEVSAQVLFATPEQQAVVDGFTELERKFINKFINALYAEPHFSDVDVNDMAFQMSLPKPTVKGVLGSLVKKGVVTTEGVNGYDIIYLNADYFFLHPEWNTQELY